MSIWPWWVFPEAAKARWPNDFFLGTALGMLPGIVAITVFADRVVAVVKNPDWKNIIVAAGIAMILVIGGWLTQKRLRSRGWNKNNATQAIADKRAHYRSDRAVF